MALFEYGKVLRRVPLDMSMHEIWIWILNIKILKGLFIRTLDAEVSLHKDLSC
jgi:hypothetical protein